MNLENRSLVLDLVEWVAAAPRPYRAVMEAWRTSCPRLAVWEEAIDHGLVERSCGPSGRIMVEATRRGRALLDAAGRAGGAGRPT